MSSMLWLPPYSKLLKAIPCIYMRKLASIVLSLLILFLCHPSIALAATSRSSWVKNEIYQYNHPFAAQLPQELATKMQKMAKNSFAFYRGTAHIFYRDMATLPASNYVPSSTSAIWLQGDMHLENMGAFQDSKGNQVFDTNDFDEAYLGPYIWDLRRMAVSLLLAAKEIKLSLSDCNDIVRAFLDAYLDKMKDFKGTDEELSYRLEESNTTGLVKDLIQKAQKKTRSHLLDKYTAINTDGIRVFKTTSELQPVASEVYNNIAAAMSNYIQSIAGSKRYSNSYYKLKDARLKLGSGTGNLGRYRYFLLIEGPSISFDDDRILEMKQETTSDVAIAASGRLPGSAYNNHEGQRVAMASKAMLTNTDVLLGYTTLSTIPCTIREKSPYEVDFDYSLLTSKSQYIDVATYVGKVLAKNHAVADRDYDPSIVPYNADKEIVNAINGNKGAFQQEIINFAADYSTQVEYDYASFLDAYQQGATLY